ncbi:MAG: septum site-determining protein MinD [Clostridia bacterium]
MGEAIVITSGKGGVGKTTLSANLGAALALLNKKVLLIDTDIGLRNLDVILGLENRIVYDIVDVCEGVCDFKKATIRDKRFEGLFIIPAAQSKDKTAITPLQMKNLVRKLKEEYDYIIIDCPAGIEQGFENAVAGADRAIVVAVPEVSSVRDADRIIGLLEKHDIENVKLVVNRLRQKMVDRGDMLSIEDMLDILAIDLLGAVPDDESIIVCANNGTPCITDMKSKAGQAYRNIAKRVLGENVPLEDLSERKNIFSRLIEVIRG